MNIERDHGSLVIEFEKGRAASAGRSSRRAFEDPPLLDQVFHDQGNGTALQAGDAGKIGARERLARSDKIEDKVSVYLAWRFVRCALPAGKCKPRRLWSSHEFAFWLKIDAVQENKSTTGAGNVRYDADSDHLLRRTERPPPGIFDNESLYHRSSAFCRYFELLFSRQQNSRPNRRMGSN
jgi:hypothetical protein